MIIGFTGTRHGMTAAQQKGLRWMLRPIDAVTFDRFVHGDCIGADEQAHAIALELRIPIEIHPSTHPLRAHCEGADVVMNPRPPLDRNRVIVKRATTVIAAPAEDTPQARGGTWSTIRAAIGLGRRTVIIWPGGIVQLAYDGDGGW